MYKIKKENLTALFRAIAAEQELYVPVKSAGKVNFGPWSEDAEVDIDTLKSVKSPKDIFFPQSENLYTCELGRPEAESRAGSVKRAEIYRIWHESL